MRDYPHSAGHRGIDTSIEAARAIDMSVGHLQRIALRAIRAAGGRGLTTNELVAAVQIHRDSIQPRTTELSRKGLICDSGLRRRNANGKLAIVWVAETRTKRPSSHCSQLRGRAASPTRARPMTAGEHIARLHPVPTSAPNMVTVPRGARPVFPSHLRVRFSQSRKLFDVELIEAGQLGPKRLSSWPTPPEAIEAGTTEAERRGVPLAGATMLHITHLERLGALSEKGPA